MYKSGSLNRRRFVKLAGMTALAARPGMLRASGAASVEQDRFTFVGAAGTGVHVYATDGKTWRLRQIVASEAPVSLALHSSGRWLYVLNGVSEHQGLPCGSVETYTVDAKSGRLDLLGRRGLSLSATMPRHLTVSPDGLTVMVAVHGGGAYNLLPILADGSVGRVTGILKETGCGPVAEYQDAAHPQATLFDTTGRRVIATDLGGDRISVLSLEQGLEVASRYEMPGGSGPRHLALHPAGHLLYVGNALDGALSAFSYDANTGTITDRLWQIHSNSCEAMVMDQAGKFLYTASRDAVTMWRIESANGDIHRLDSQDAASIGHVHGLMMNPDGRKLALLTDLGVAEMTSAESGRLGEPLLMAPVERARCIATIGNRV